MKIEIREIGRLIVEMTITGAKGSLKEDIANNEGFIDEYLIEDLKDIVNMLEERNELRKQ